MEEIEHKADAGTTAKYLALLKMIFRLENRLTLSELVYLTINVFIVMFAVGLIAHIPEKSLSLMAFFRNMTLAAFFPVMGMSICVYWIAWAMRLQLKLKVRYFQARYLERKMGSAGEFICSDESLFFNPSVRRLESPDKVEAVMFPESGLTRMDGFLGAAKPRYFSWMMPTMFFGIHAVTFIWVAVRLLAPS